MLVREFQHIVRLDNVFGCPAPQCCRAMRSITTSMLSHRWFGKGIWLKYGNSEYPYKISGGCNQLWSLHVPANPGVRLLTYSYGQNAKGLNRLTFRWSPWQTLYPSFSHLYGYQFLPTTFREDKSSSRRSNHLNHLDHSASQIGSSLQRLGQTFQQSERILRDTIASITNNWRSSSHESWVWNSKMTQLSTAL